MSQPTELNIEHVARLARLRLTADEKERFGRQLGEVLHHIEQLAKVDIAHVEPAAHAFPVFNVWAEDASQPALSAERALRNAPAQRDQMVVVPKVVD